MLTWFIFVAWIGLLINYLFKQWDRLILLLFLSLCIAGSRSQAVHQLFSLITMLLISQSNGWRRSSQSLQLKHKFTQNNLTRMWCISATSFMGVLNLKMISLSDNSLSSSSDSHKWLIDPNTDQRLDQWWQSTVMMFLILSFLEMVFDFDFFLDLFLQVMMSLSSKILQLRIKLIDQT